MGGGKAKEYTEKQAGIGATQQQWASDIFGQGTKNIDIGLETLTPMMDYYKAMASGDPTKMAAAAAPMIRQFTGAKKQALSEIQNTLPAGAGRTFAKASVARDAAGQTAAAMNAGFLGAQDKLGDLGNMFLNLGRGQQSGGFSGTSSAAGIYGNAAQAELERSKAKWGAITSLVGKAMSPFTGGLSSMFTKAVGGGGAGGGGGVPYNVNGGYGG